MTTPSHGKRKRRLFRNRRGYSALLATIIMVMVVLFLYFNVFMITLDRNTDYQDAITRSNRLDEDKHTELASLNVTSYALKLQPNLDSYMLHFDLTNNGPLPVEIVRIWITGLPQGLGMSLPFPLPLPNVWAAGTKADVMRGIPIAVSSYYLNRGVVIFAVTSRGNVISQRVPTPQ